MAGTPYETHRFVFEHEDWRGLDTWLAFYQDGLNVLVRADASLDPRADVIERLRPFHVTTAELRIMAKGLADLADKIEANVGEIDANAASVSPIRQGVLIPKPDDAVRPPEPTTRPPIRF